jgi:hypothetical protein
VSGSGWTGYDSITVSLVAGTGSTFMCFTSANAGGDIAAQTCTVPGSIPEGSYTLSATDGTLTATTPFTLHPGVSVLGFDGSDVLGVAAGQSLTLTGSGFAPSSSLKATFNGTAVALKPTVTTNTVGQFTGTGFVVPATTVQGRYPLVIKDAAGNSSTVHLDVYAATLTATPSPGVAGAAIALSGSGWPINDPLRVQLDLGTGATFVCFAGTDDNGTLNQSCTVPTSLIEGAYTLVVEDNSLAVSTPFTLHPGVSVLGFDGSDVLGVAAGQSLTLTGSGFAPSSSLKATFNGTAVALKPTVTTNTVGQFTGTGFVVPATTVQGRYPLVIKDAAGNSSTVHLDVYAATLTATPSPGVAGAAIALSGSGWPINDPLRVQLDLGTGATFVCFAGTDGNGTLNQSCTVPTSLIEGAYSLVVEDNSLAVTTPFTLDPGVTISNSSGQPFASAAPGTAAELSGSGFDADSTIASVTFGTHAVAFSPKPESGPTGSFSDAAFTIPSVAPGVYTVTVKDAAGHSGTVPFTIT